MNSARDSSQSSSPSTVPSPYVVLRDSIDGENEWTGFRSSPRPSVHLREYWKVLRKHRWLIAAVFAASVVSVAVTVYTMKPKYTATAQIEIERRSPKIAPVEGVDHRDDDFSYDAKYDYYQTRFRILQSRSVVARVIRALGLDNDERFLSKSGEGFVDIVVESFSGLLSRLLPADRQDEAEGEASISELGVDPRLIDSYLRMLSVTPVRNSRLVQIAFTSGDRVLATEVANRHIEEYVNSDVERRLDLNVRAQRFLEGELAKARDRVVAAEATLNAYRKEHGVLSVDGDKTDIVSERLEDLSKRYTEAQGDRIRLEGQYKLVQQRAYQSLPSVVASELVNQLKRGLSVAEAERAKLAEKYQPEYPKMAEAMARERQLKERLNAEISNIVSSIESGYLAARNREESLKNELETQRVAALAQKDISADYRTLARDVETARDLYKSLLQRLKDVDVAEEIKVSDVSVVDRAAVPLRPSSPKKLLSIALAAIAGLGLGLFLAFFLEYMDNTLRTPRDVEERLGLPTLGVVPDFDSAALGYGGYGYRPASSKEPPPAPPMVEDESRALSEEVIVSSHPRSVIAESYRTIRTKILLGSADTPIQVILFTSAAPAEGKTVTAVNEALALAQSGGRVLVIDADIRRPRLHRLLSAPNGHGLSTYLAGQSKLVDVVHEVPLNGLPRTLGNGAGGVVQGSLFILPAGPLPPNPAELLGSRRMRDTLEQLRSDYDYIILDTPPILPVADAVVLSSFCDGVVLVVRGQETPVPQVRQAKADLEGARARILGVVLNDVDVSSGDYYDDYRYRYDLYQASEGVDS